MPAHSQLCALAFAVVLTLGSGCDSGSETQPQPPPAPAPGREAASPAPQKTPAAPSPEVARAEAEQIFATRCFTCHGVEGAGDGPGSKALSPRPRNFQDVEWQASVSDEHIEKIIMYGGAAVGRALTMPPNPDLTSKPEVVAALRAHVRGLAAR